MTYQYGQGLAEQTLQNLSSVENPLYRLLKGWSEIDVMNFGDTKSELFARVTSWKEEYLNENFPNAEKWDVVDDEIRRKVRLLMEELVAICCDIIEYNSSAKASKQKSNMAK